MKRLILLGALALTGGCSEQRAVEDAVKEFLNDPESAKFGEITIVENADGKEACATTNAKNRMGGYTGNKQITLSYNDKLQKWSAINGWNISHAMCVDIISDEQEDTEGVSETAAQDAL